MRLYQGAFLLLAAALLATAACTNEPGIAPANAGAILNKAVARSVNLDSYRFKSRTRISTAAGTKTVLISGDWHTPNRLSMTMISDGLRQNVVIIGGQAYTKPEGLNKWTNANLSAVAQAQGIQSTLKVLRQFKKAASLSDAKIGGVVVRHIRADYDLSVFAAGQGENSAAPAGAAADIWIEKATGYLRRISIKSVEKSDSTAGIDIDVQVTLSRFNKIKQIEPPALQ